MTNDHLVYGLIHFQYLIDSHAALVTNPSTVVTPWAWPKQDELPCLQVLWIGGWSSCRCCWCCCGCCSRCRGSDGSGQGRSSRCGCRLAGISGTTVNNVGVGCNLVQDALGRFDIVFRVDNPTLFLLLGWH